MFIAWASFHNGLDLDKSAIYTPKKNPVTQSRKN